MQMQTAENVQMHWQLDDDGDDDDDDDGGAVIRRLIVGCLMKVEL
jgi:hypothetical protein